MPINIDWNQAEDSNFEPLEPGTYNATITKCALSEKPGPSGYHMIDFEFQLADSNRRAWKSYSLHPKAMWGLKEALTKLGVEVPAGEMDFDNEALIGTKVELTLSLEDHWQGKQGPDGKVLKVNNVVDLKPADAFAW